MAFQLYSSASPLAASAATPPAMEAGAPGLSLSRAEERAEASKTGWVALGKSHKLSEPGVSSFAKFRK